MKKLVIAISILGSLSGAASAADLAVKAVAPQPVQSWSGFYIGGHGGYGWMDDPFTQPLTLVGSPSINGLKARGWVGGGQVGYNWQYGAVVGGLELDVSATGIKGTSATITGTSGLVTVTETESDNVKLLGSARGRLGFAPNSDWLLYGTGGLAWDRLDQTNVTVTSGVLSAATTTLQPVDLFGWTLGVGVETRILQSNWIARFEYLHYDFGHSRLGFVVVSGSNQTTGDQTIDVVRAGISYKFGG